MASELLKTFEKIESGRKGMIDILNDKGFNVPANASLGSISTLIHEATRGYSNDYKYFEYATPLTYYDNPDDDPDVYQKPKFWPDIESIIRSKGIITYEEIQYYPIKIALIEECPDVVNFKTVATGTHQTTITAEDDIYIGCYNRHVLIETSDGAFIHLQKATSPNITSATHTWDTTKDIVNEGHHFKYIIIYTQLDKDFYIYSSLLYGTSPNIITRSLIADAFTCQHTIKTESNTSYSTIYMLYGKPINDTIEHVKLIDPVIPLDLMPTNNRSKYIHSNLTSPNCIYLEIDIAENEVQKSSKTRILFQGTRIRRIKNNNKYISCNASFRSDVFCVESPTIYSYTVDATAVDINSKSSKPIVISQLKYGICDRDATIELVTGTGYIGEPRRTAGYTKYPYLKDFSMFEGCTGFDSLKGSCPNCRVLDLYNYTGTPNSDIEILTLHTSKTFSLPGKTSVNIKRIYLPNVTTMYCGYYGDGTSGSQSSSEGSSDYIRELYMPSLTEITGSSSNLNHINLNAPSLEVFYAPSLTSVPSDIFFRTPFSLTTLVLGEGFKSTMDFQYCCYLSHESIIRLFNTIATLTEEDAAMNYTITLPKYGKSVITNFTEDELNIARNKGWIVK